MIQTHLNLKSFKITIKELIPFFSDDSPHVKIEKPSSDLNNFHHINLLVRPKLKAPWLPLGHIEENRHFTTEIKMSSGNAFSRCHIPVTRIQINTQFPFGLYRAFRYQEISSQLIIYPARKNHPQFSHQQNELNAAESGQQDLDFVDFQKYREGESLKSISWKLLAKTDELFTKNFRAYLQNNPHFHLHELHDQEKQEKQLEWLSFQFWEAQQNNLTFSFTVNDEIYGPSNQEEFYQLCLQKIAQY